ncbi:MAG: OsmC family protein [Gemmatimonadetes bacterium]|nr:OsmC family protein [Gemmatimonadota bacterium]
MRLVLESETRARLEMSGDGLEIASEGASISPYHLLAGSLSTCTALTLQRGRRASRSTWRPSRFTSRGSTRRSGPARIRRIEMELRCPGFPEERKATAERVADLCPIHATLTRAAEVSRRIVVLTRKD